MRKVTRVRKVKKFRDANRVRKRALRSFGGAKGANIERRGFENGASMLKPVVSKVCANIGGGG